MIDFNAKTIAILCSTQDPLVKEVEITTIEFFEEIIEEIINRVSWQSLVDKRYWNFDRIQFKEAYTFLVENSKINISNE